MLSPKELKESQLKALSGYGLMNLTWAPSPAPQERAFGALDKVLEISTAKPVPFNVGEFYGPNFSNLHLARDYFKARPSARKDVLVSCKGCIDNETLVPAGDRASVSRSIENCIREFGGPIDIFEPARLVPEMMDETFETIVEYIKKGDLGGLSLSEVTAEQIRAVHAKFGEYLCCVEVEMSLFVPDILTNGIADTCNELGIPIVCYSPLCNGLLTGAITSTNDVPDGAFKKNFKRLNGGSLEHNLKLVHFLQHEIVEKRQDGITLPNVALAWVRSFNDRYPNTRFIPIPGGSSAKRVEQNFKVFELSPEELTKVNDFLKEFETAGGRYEMV